MATGWAVGSATLLAFSAVGLNLIAGPHAHEPWFAFFAFVPLFGAWAYAIAMGAHGSRTAIVALAGHTLVAGIGIPYLLGATSPIPLMMAIAAGLVAALTLWSLVDEARRRGGRIHPFTLLALWLPLIITGAVVWAANLKLAILGQ